MSTRFFGLLLLLSVSSLSYASTDSLWVVGGAATPGELLTVEVWLRYEGSGPDDSMSAFDIPLVWNAAICTVEAVTIGTDFIDSAGLDWTDVSKVDNTGSSGAPGVPKLLLSAFTFGPPFAPFVARGSHLAATVDFRVLESTTIPDSTYVDTLGQAFTPPSYIGFVDKKGMETHMPVFGGEWIVAQPPAYDFGPALITNLPDEVHLGSSYAPSVIVKNFRADSVGPIIVVCDIGSWTDTVKVVAIAGQSSTCVTFDNWAVPDTGVHSVTVSTGFETGDVSATLTKDIHATSPQE